MPNPSELQRLEEEAQADAAAANTDPDYPANGLGDDKVFAIDMGLGRRLSVYVMGPPESYKVAISDPDRGAWISIDRCDWERLVERVKEQF